MSLPTKWRGLCVVLLLVLAPIQSLWARELTTAEQTALAEAVERFNGYMTTQDWQGMLAASLPPRVMDDLLKSGGTKEQLIKATVDAIEAAMAKAQIQEFAMDLTKAEKREHADGTPYLLIPTDTVILVEGGDKIAVRAHTLGMMDAGQWYLVRVSDPQQKQMLARTYPEYATVEFPASTTQILKE